MQFPCHGSGSKLCTMTQNVRWNDLSFCTAKHVQPHERSEPLSKRERLEQMLGVDGQRVLQDALNTPLSLPYLPTAPRPLTRWSWNRFGCGVRVVWSSRCGVWSPLWRDPVRVRCYVRHRFLSSIRCHAFDTFVVVFRSNILNILIMGQSIRQGSCAVTRATRSSITSSRRILFNFGKGHISLEMFAMRRESFLATTKAHFRTWMRFSKDCLKK